MTLSEKVSQHFKTSATAFAALAEDDILLDRIVKAAEYINQAFRDGGRLYIVGNGGSAADAQHFAAELVGYFGSKKDKPLPATALTTDSSFLTAWPNDAKPEDIFARQLGAHARGGDVLFAISTSGNSENIIRAFEMAHFIGMARIALLGASGGKVAKLLHAHISLCVPHQDTPTVQEMHIAVIHAICKCIER
jgi:D-sedoheptulose 7-phosphate isomerase